MKTLSFKSKIRFGLCALAIMGLGACSSIDIEIPEDKTKNPLPLIENQIKVKRLWSADVGSRNEQDFSKLVPGVTERAIFTVSSRGLVSARDNAKGKKLWSKELKETISGGVFAGYGVVLVGSNEGKVSALKTENGDMLWQFNIGGEILAPPQSNGRIVVVQSANGTVHGLDLKTGEKKWIYQTSVPALTLRGTSTPKIEKQFVYAGFANGKVVALDIISGRAYWEMNVHIPEGGSELEQVIDVDGHIITEGGKLFASSYQGKIAALDQASGRPRWKVSSSNYVGLEKGIGNIYSIEDSGEIVAYDSNRGDPVWTQDKLKGRQLSTPSSQENYLVVGDSEGYLYWIQQGDGKIVARKRFTRGSIAAYHTGEFKGLRRVADKPEDFRVFSRAVEKNGILYVQNQFGALAAYQIQ